MGFVRQGSGQSLGHETKRTRVALETYPAVDPDQVKAVRPSCILLLDAIRDGVNQRRHCDVKPAHACGGDVLTLCIRGWVSKENTFPDVTLHLPDIRGMRLVDVNDEERRAVSVLLV